jgi:hypothetical protein
MTHISGEKSKRGEIRFPKMGIAIFISEDTNYKKSAKGWRQREAQWFPLIRTLGVKWESSDGGI